MKKRYLLFHKPYGVLSQFTGEIGQRTLAEFNLPKDVYAVGRLDKDSEGLLLLSNDGPFIKEFLLNHPRTYWAQVEGSPTESDLDRLRAGVKIKTGLTAPCRVKILEHIQIADRDPPIRFRKSIPTTWLEIILKEGKNRQVRRMSAVIGFPTLRLIRVGLGKIDYRFYSDLPQGDWLELSKQNIV